MYLMYKFDEFKHVYACETKVWLLVLIEIYAIATSQL